MTNLNLKKGASRRSAYDLRKSRPSAAKTHTLSILVDNEAGVLARIVGLFAGRGFNIESLTVTEIDHTGHLSRITVVSTANDDIIRQIRAQLKNVISVHEIVDLTYDGPSIERELALHLVDADDRDRQKICALADKFKARLLDTPTGQLVIEQTGTPHDIDRLFDQLREMGLKEVSRTGVVGLQLDDAH
ncbi:MAG: acetolactate synthase small subunit [Rhodobacteraceae bacterium]|nr:acetolactate synthase small subunit [Paracoccaceae bacterium]MCY4196708.1 acetolactate synthase small subunit [Paracoccaceae bacterium]